MSVLVSVCLLVTTASCAKTAEPIEMPFGMWIGTVVLGGARISLGEWASLGYWLTVTHFALPQRVEG